MNIVGLVGEIDAFLGRLDIAHAFGGALALAYYAEPRGTMDVDLNVFVAFSSARDIVDAMGDLDLFAEAPSSEWLPVAGVRMARRSDGTRVDLFFSVDEESYAEIRDRVNWFPFGGHQRVPFLSAEDLVVFKMSFNRDKDWVDIRNLIGHTPNLDIEYVERKLISVRGPTMFPRLAVLRRIVNQVTASRDAPSGETHSPAAKRTAAETCGRLVERTGQPCLLAPGHGGRCRSVLPQRHRH